ncbi:2-keto-4-pentenoate hydratase [Mycobacterium sp. AT1]|uniref:2-keto-4-pentenoate hydratase n=1 Tax=Mycobacterium sp. AT1 TaxID=1961706 RepID=UPI0009AC8A1B|nr:fumarylacetoacetate hydrolase family protein [Mycobacterium sp. AT1]OPX10660.1 2-keto-4-pentenoate hydratase [Mycobacterium sp. AT1]
MNKESTLPGTLLRDAADRLIGAAASGIQCDPIRDLVGGTDIATGYAIQRLLTETSLAQGRRVVGHKIGLTSPAVQRQLGVDQPDSGVLYADMDVSGFPSIPTAKLLQPKIEAEVGFILAEDLDGELTADRVRAAAGQAVAALEIVDSRIKDWSISIVDTVADNGSSALFVLGENPVPVGELDFASLRMTLTEDGQKVSEGDGAACLGDPLTALAWLARTARANGTPLLAGHIVLSGALGPMVPVVPGRTYVAVIDELGTATASFTHRTSHDSEGGRL